MAKQKKFTRYIEPTSPELCLLLQVSGRTPIVDQDRRMTSREAATYLNLSNSTLSKMRAQERSPAYWKADGKNGAILYPVSGLIQYKRALQVMVPCKYSKRLAQVEFAFGT